MSFGSTNLFRSNEIEQGGRTHSSPVNKGNIDWNILGDIEQDTSGKWELLKNYSKNYSDFDDFDDYGVDYSKFRLYDNNKLDDNFKNGTEAYFTSKYDDRFRCKDTDGREWNPMLYKPYNLFKYLEGIKYDSDHRSILARNLVKLRRGIRVYNRYIQYNMTREEVETYSVHEWGRIIDPYVHSKILVDLSWGGLEVYEKNDGTKDLHKLNWKQIVEKVFLPSQSGNGITENGYLRVPKQVADLLYLRLDKYDSIQDFLEIKHYFEHEFEDEPQLIDIREVFAKNNVPVANRIKLNNFQMYYADDELRGIATEEFDSLVDLHAKAIQYLFRYICSFVIDTSKASVFYKSYDTKSEYVGVINKTPNSRYGHLSGLPKWITDVESVYDQVHTALAKVTYDYLKKFPISLRWGESEHSADNMVHVGLCGLATLSQKNVPIDEVRDMIRWSGFENPIDSEHSTESYDIDFDGHLNKFIIQFVKAFNSKRNTPRRVLFDSVKNEKEFINLYYEKFGGLRDGHSDSLQSKESLESGIVDKNFEVTKDEIEIIELVENMSAKDFVESVSSLGAKTLAADLYRFVRLLSKHLK